MLTLEERLELYQGKKCFIDTISKAFKLSETGVAKVDYEVYSKYNPVYDTTYYAEFIVVTFAGGGKSVRTATGNSNTANFNEIAKLIEGGYYDELEYYNDIRNNCELMAL